MPGIKERRRRQRVDAALPIEIKYNSKKIKTRTKNISVLGTYLELNQEIPIGTALDIEIKIPKKVSSAGTAFRCQVLDFFGTKKRYGIGIFFRSFARDGERDLARYIDYVLRQEKRIGKIYIRKRRQKQAKKKGGR